jgi:hypothetical protein
MAKTADKPAKPADEPKPEPAPEREKDMVASVVRNADGSPAHPGGYEVIGLPDDATPEHVAAANNEIGATRDDHDMVVQVSRNADGSPAQAEGYEVIGIPDDADDEHVALAENKPGELLGKGA